jgi:serine/threonine protein kinase
MDIPEISDSNGNNYGSFIFFKKGGMGEIYKGYELATKKEVVIKLIHIENPSNERLLQTELDISENLSHKNIVSSLNTGKLEIEENTYLYMIQDYYSKGNLRTIIKEDIPIEDCFSIMSDILSGMKEIHKVVVHRDLKPENILIDSNNSLLITDFGLSKYVDDKTRTQSYKGAGTIPYMAPECWTGDTNTISMDIYSLGIIFFEIVTGHKPYNANTYTEWRECHLFNTFPNISEFRTGSITKINQIIQKMSNKRPNQRYKTIDDIITSINEAKAINITEVNAAEGFAKRGNSIIQSIKTEELKLQQAKEKKAEWISFLNFEINDLLNKFKEKVSAINERLEENKIIIKEKHSLQNFSTSREINISFLSKNIKICFIDHDLIKNNNKDLKEESLNFQRQRFGYTMNTPVDSYFIKNNFVLIGLAETNYKIGDYEFGFNLILQKIEGSNYGEWKLMQFSENTTPPKTKFGIDLFNFFENFGKIHNSMFHHMELRELKDEDILSLIDKIF